MGGGGLVRMGGEGNPLAKLDAAVLSRPFQSSGFVSVGMSRTWRELLRTPHDVDGRVEGPDFILERPYLIFVRLLLAIQFD